MEPPAAALGRGDAGDSVGAGQDWRFRGRHSGKARLCGRRLGRSPATIPGVDCRAGIEALHVLLAETDVLVNILPSTEATRGLLNRDRLNRLPIGAAIVNGSRGDQLDLDALVERLNSGHLRGALLDVFPNQPLPAQSPLWRHPKLKLTPHVAARTLPGPSVRQILENIRRLEAGESLDGVVDRRRGY